MFFLFAACQLLKDFETLRTNRVLAWVSRRNPYFSAKSHDRDPVNKASHDVNTIGVVSKDVMVSIACVNTYVSNDLGYLHLTILSLAGRTPVENSAVNLTVRDRC